MFEFARPSVLLLMLLVPPLAWYALRRPRGALRFSSTGPLASLPPGRGRAARWGGVLLRAAGLLLLVAALAGPRWPDLRTRVPTEGIAIQMVMDVSGSMAERDFTWDRQQIPRLEGVKRAFRLFVAGGEGPGGERLDGRPNDLVGLVTFATWPTTACPLTLSHSVLLQLLDAQQPRTVPTESRTNIGDAIAWGLHRLASAGPRRKVLILLSDGEHNVPSPALTPRQAAQLAASAGVPIYTIDAGGEGGTGLEAPPAGEGPTPAEIRAAGEQALKAIAEITGGRSFQARDTGALLGVCQEIDRLERRPIESFVYRRYYEGYPWFGLGALGCVAGVLALERTWWRRLP